jgi:AraC-like DNA-binding protein
MASKEDISSRAGLERSCQQGRFDWIRSKDSGRGIELFEAWFQGHAFDKHCHDTYAIGLTECGVQSFTYRGVTQLSTAGKVVVLHPDELHDGDAGDDTGFGYRILYVDPALIQAALRSALESRSELPFVPQPVLTNRRLAGAVRSAFCADLEPLAIDGLILALAEGLIEEDPCIRYRRPARKLDQPAVERARQFLDAEKSRVVRSKELEVITGLSRYDLARQFRAAFGTSPYRYLLMRRLEFVRKDLCPGQSLAELSVNAGFADQAHFTRMFKAAYGLTPARYAKLRRRGNREPL